MCGTQAINDVDDERRDQFLQNYAFAVVTQRECQFRSGRVGPFGPFLNRIMDEEQLMREIVKNNFYGIVKIDIDIPPEKRHRWRKLNFGPIITRKSLDENQLSPETVEKMKKFKKKIPVPPQLIPCFEAEGLIIPTDMLLWYMKYLGAGVTKLHWAIQVRVL